MVLPLGELQTVLFLVEPDHTHAMKAFHEFLLSLGLALSKTENACGVGLNGFSHPRASE